VKDAEEEKKDEKKEKDKEEQKEVEIVEVPWHKKQKQKYVKKEPAPPPKMVARKKTAAKKVKNRVSQKMFKSLKCPRMERVETLSLNNQTTNKGNKSAEDWLRALGYSEEEITKMQLEPLMGHFLGERSMSSHNTPPDYMDCNNHWLKLFEIPEEFLKVFLLISVEIDKNCQVCCSTV
jgi:chromatin remodeling complex protein RSC6